MAGEHLHEADLAVVHPARVFADAYPRAMHVTVRIAVPLALLHQLLELRQRLRELLELEPSRIDEDDRQPRLRVLADLPRHGPAVARLRQLALKNRVDERALPDAAPAGDEHRRLA